MLLDRLLSDLSIQVEPFAVCRVSDTSRLRFRGFGWVTLHFVLEGRGRMHGAGRTVDLRPSTLVVVPPGTPHSIEGMARSTGTAGDLEVACGRINAVYGPHLGLFDRLPGPLVVDFAGSPDVERVFARLLEEAQAETAGLQAMTSALMRECLVLLLRKLCAEPDCSLPWLRALDDPGLADVVDLILAQPEQPHSVDSLAASASMSRTAFATAFATSFGQTPMAFVREVRLRRAAELLRTTTLSIDGIARAVGYDSRSQFSRAFQRLFMEAPGRYRQV
ncbi:MAG: helix-turn-helix domain-containing protein [Chloroflexota bacterium]